MENLKYVCCKIIGWHHGTDKATSIDLGKSIWMCLIPSSPLLHEQCESTWNCHLSHYFIFSFISLFWIEHRCCYFHITPTDVCSNILMNSSLWGQWYLRENELRPCRRTSIRHSSSRRAQKQHFLLFVWCCRCNCCLNNTHMNWPQKLIRWTYMRISSSSYGILLFLFHVKVWMSMHSALVTCGFVVMAVCAMLVPHASATSTFDPDRLRLINVAESVCSTEILFLSWASFIFWVVVCFWWKKERIPCELRL